MGLPNKIKFPDFMGIGTTRGGSSWLHHVLDEHPDIWVSPLKELHYFDRQMDGKRTFLVDKSKGRNRIKRYLQNEWNTNRDGLLASLAWDWTFYSGKRSGYWYQTLFAFAGSRLAGEVTPAYAILEKEVISRIISYNPDMNAIYLLRDPIERGWSSIVNGLAKKKRRSIKKVPKKEILEKIESSGFLARSNYADNIRTWQDAIGSDHLFIGFFEDIKNRPAALIDQLCNFLGVRGSEVISDKRLRQPRNASGRYSSDIPPDIAVYLAERLFPMIRETQKLLGGYADQWMEHAERILSGR